MSKVMTMGSFSTMTTSYVDLVTTSHKLIEVEEN